MKHIYCLVIFLLLSALADAQTETVPDNAGATVVEVITENAAGVITTRVIQTLGGATTSQTALTTSTTATSLTQTTTGTQTTSTTQPIGPVEQTTSAAGTPGGPTPYQYTTTDANGNTIVQTGVFTPTGPSTVLPQPTTTGTILPYSQWLSMIGTYTVPASAARRMSTPIATGWYYFAATGFAGLAGGVWLVFLW